MVCFVLCGCVFVAGFCCVCVWLVNVFACLFVSVLFVAVPLAVFSL